jgi:alkylhydroperoxidase/carboxymuconolactone decarboxylase family protein YurZ
MYLPKVYEKFSSEYPELFQQYNQLGTACRNAGPLDEKTQNLVKLGISIGVNSRGGVMSSTRKAIESGASPEEIVHAALLAMTNTGFPNMIAALGWVEEVISQE